MEIALKKSALYRLDEILQQRKQRRIEYRKLARGLSYMAIYTLILFLQRNPTIAFEVFDSLGSVVPAGSAASMQTMFSKEDLYKWLSSVVFPAWNDPVCGDGVCSFPAEYPAFGLAFGCAADCGLSTVPTTPVTVSLVAAYIVNAQTLPVMQAQFVAQTSWNLCFTSNYSNAPTQQCWFPQDQYFNSSSQTVSMTLHLPDAEWVINLNAPLGSVVGSISIGANANSSNAGQALTGWSFCVPRSTRPSPRRLLTVQEQGAAPRGEPAGGGARVVAVPKPLGGMSKRHEEVEDALAAAAAAYRSGKPAAARAAPRPGQRSLKSMQATGSAPSPLVRRSLESETTPLVPFDLSGTGLEVSVDGAIQVLDAATGIRIHVLDNRPYMNSSTPLPGWATGPAGPLDIRLNELSIPTQAGLITALPAPLSGRPPSPHA